MSNISDEYKTVTSEVAEGFYSEKRSKFFAFVHHVTSESDIKNIIAAYHKSHYDARHICYAYVLGPDKAHFRANDDGEPSSTAGKPILGQIIKNDLTDILVDSVHSFKRTQRIKQMVCQRGKVLYTSVSCHISCQKVIWKDSGWSL